MTARSVSVRAPERLKTWRHGLDSDGAGEGTKTQWSLKGPLLFIGKILLAGGIVAWLAAKNFSGLADCLKSFNLLWLAPAAALYALHLFANAWRWWLLMKVQRIECGLGDACSITMQSLFFSLVIPGGAVGGDLVRVGFLAARIPKGRKFEGAFTILMDRFTGMIGIFLVALLMLPFTWWAIVRCEGIMDTFVRLIIAGSSAGLMASVAVFLHREFERLPLFLKCKALADRFGGGLFSRVADALDTYKECPKELAACVLSSVLFVNLNLAVVAYCVAMGTGDPGASFTVALAAITVGNIVGLLPLTPSGVGARDVFVMAILQAGGMAGGAATASTLLITALILMFNMLGGIFFVIAGARRRPASWQDTFSQ